MNHHCRPHEGQHGLRALGEGREGHVPHVTELHPPGGLVLAGGISLDEDTEAADLEHGQATCHWVSQSDHQSQAAFSLGDDGHAGELDLGCLGSRNP